MFTLSFYEHESNDKTVVCGHRYDVRYLEVISGYEVDVHNKADDVGCVSYRVGEENRKAYGDNDPMPPKNYRTCYVTNSDGKTIDRFDSKD